MKYITYLAASVLLFTWIACGHGRPYEESVSSGANPAVIPANSTIQPQTIPMNLNSQTTAPAVIPTNTTVAPGMNPPHGQPGHRCDIAVGAPLNSPPGPQPATTATTPVSTPINISTNKLTQPAVTTTAPGMNPPHGQPGHRCDIAVGAPLNSKAAEQPPITKVAPGMNPPHGQPGHRCEIAVGAPLDSKPVMVTGTPSTNTVSSSQIIPSVVPINALPDSSKQYR